MTKVKIHIDNIRYTNKPKDFMIIKPRLQNDTTIQELELSELVDKIGQGYSVSPGIMKGGMSASNWIEQSLFMIDIDNANTDLPMLSLKEALKICNDNNIVPVFYYYTFSHSKDIPKYRLAFLMDKPITDKNIREKIVLTLIDLFPQSDEACKNADRIFLGTNKQVRINSNLSLVNVDNIFSLAKPRLIKSSNIKNNSRSDKELEKLISDFDLLDYMKKDNEVSRMSEDIVYFKDCSICGHNDCLRYYYKNNSFHCFGANGNKGGTIIDYLMLTEKLTLQQAIRKFKCELCGIDNDNDFKNFEYISATDLSLRELPAVNFYVSEVIPQGLTLICSVPKLGKSWLALQLCLSITRGDSFLGFETKQCACLYLALEDSYNRIKERMLKQLKGSQAPPNLYFNINNKNLSSGLVEELEKFLIQYADVKVIIIDTLQKVRGDSKGTNVYANDYKELSLLKSFADKHGIGIILIHHLKKGLVSNDVFERVSGTNGITGTADTTLILSKEDRADKETKLSIVGRDVEYNDYIIRFNGNDCIWEMISSLDDYKDYQNKQTYQTNTLVATIKILVENNNDIWQGTFKEINLKHQELYNDLYATSELTLKRDVDKFKSLMLSNDNIKYIPANNPSKNGRIQTFRKVK